MKMGKSKEPQIIGIKEIFTPKDHNPEIEYAEPLLV